MKDEYLHESEQESSGGVTNWLFGIPQAVDDSGNKRIEVKFEMLAGEHSGRGQSLKCALTDPEVVIFQEIQATIDERSNLG